MAGAFWFLLALSGYTYFGYPLLACVLGAVRRRRVCKGAFEPSVSILIAAYNEAAHIGATIENKTALDYPAEKLEIIVISDGSTDGTDEIAAAHPRVTVLRQEPRRGKTAALNMGVERAAGDILVFSDANSLYAADALRHLTRNFCDPEVGYVTGRMRYRADGGTSVGLGSRAYMMYEDVLRRLETMLGSVVGVNGGIDAVRRSLYRPMKDEQLPDFVLPLRVIRDGYRVVYEPDAILTEDALALPRSEYRMRVRVALRTWWTLSEMRSLFDPMRHGIFSLQLFSHKPLRYLMGLALPALYALAIVLAGSGWIFAVTAAIGTFGLILAAAGFVVERSGKAAGPLGMPYYFLLITAAACHALIDFLRGRRQTIWNPRTGLGA